MEYGSTKFYIERRYFRVKIYREKTNKQNLDNVKYTKTKLDCKYNLFLSWCV